MHVVATNLCVWIRTLVRECVKEITQYQLKKGHGISEGYMIRGKILYISIRKELFSFLML